MLSAAHDPCNNSFDNICCSNLFRLDLSVMSWLQNCQYLRVEFVVFPIVVRLWLWIWIFPVVEAASWMAHHNYYSSCSWPWLVPHYRGFEKRPAPYTPKVSIRSYSLTYLSIQCRSGGSSSRICGFSCCLLILKPSHPTARSYSEIYYMSTFWYF